MGMTENTAPGRKMADNRTTSSRLLKSSSDDKNNNTAMSVDNGIRHCNSNGDAHRPSYCNRLILRIPRQIDVFGFNLTWPQFVVLTFLAFASLGSNGGLFIF